MATNPRHLRQMKNCALLALALTMAASQSAAADPLDMFGGEIPVVYDEFGLPDLPKLPPVFGGLPAVCLSSTICIFLISQPCYGIGIGMSTTITPLPPYVEVGVDQARGAGGYGGYC